MRRKKRLTLAEKQERVKELRPIDDVFFEVLAEEPGVLQEMLRTILGDKEIAVEQESIIVQSSKRNIYGRSVRLDALCTLGDGTRCNIEVQRSDNDDHLRRARYNASMITVKDSHAGDRFEDVVNVCIVYLSEFDFIGKGKAIYHVDKIIRETKTEIDDGLTEIFVNASSDDKTETAELMRCFLQKEVKNQKFPVLSEAVYRLKHDAKGVSAVCKVMQRYEAIARSEGRAEGREETIFGLYRDGMLGIDVAADQLSVTPEEFEQAYENFRQG